MKRFNKKWIGWILLVIALIFCLPVFLTREWIDVNFQHTGPIGDTIGGTMGPFVALLGVILTFLAFWVQYETNEDQRERFTKELDTERKKEQDRERLWQIERFEHRFYQMIHLHKSNVSEMKIGDYEQGKNCFISMFHELEFIYQILEYFNGKRVEEKRKSALTLIKLAYEIYFFGISSSSTKYYLVDNSERDIDLLNDFKDIGNQVQTSYHYHWNSDPTVKTYNFLRVLEGQEFRLRLTYTPFYGHVNRLGHYYRHLFQTAYYVTEQKYLSDEEKYSYLKNLRSQLTNFEQLLLFYNSQAWFDTQWRKLFTEYRFIKNLPIPIATIGVPPHSYYSKEIEDLKKRKISMFEWDE